jgi:hypothetical protein
MKSTRMDLRVERSENRNSQLAIVYKLVIHDILHPVAHLTFRT